MPTPAVDPLLRELLQTANEQPDVSNWSALSDWLVDQDQEDLSELVQLRTIPYLSGSETTRLAKLQEQIGRTWGDGLGWQLLWDENILLPRGVVHDLEAMPQRAFQAIEQGWTRVVILRAGPEDWQTLPENTRLVINLSLRDVPNPDNQEILRRIPHLCGFEFHEIVLITVSEIEPLNQFSKLRYLCMEGTHSVLPQGLFQSFTHLEELYLAGNQYLRELRLPGLRVELHGEPDVEFFARLSRNPPENWPRGWVDPAPGVSKLRVLDLRATSLAHYRILDAIRERLPGCIVRG